MFAQLHHWYLLISHGGWPAAAIGFGLIVFVSFIPVLPIPLIAAAVGAVDPLPLAVFSTWSAACAGALAKFFLERAILRRPVHRWLGRYRRWQTMVDYVEQNGFFAVLVTRLIPVFPSSVINTAGAVTGVSQWNFVWATLLGKIPVMVIFTIAGVEVTHHFWRTMTWLSLYGAAVGVGAWWVQAALSRSANAQKGEVRWQEQADGPARPVGEHGMKGRESQEDSGE